MKVIKTAKQFRDYVREKLEDDLYLDLDSDGFYAGNEYVNIMLFNRDVAVTLDAMRLAKISINVRRENKCLPCVAEVAGVNVYSCFYIRFRITPKQRFADIVEDAK